ncbi:Jag N-terminal domain-containing protein [Acidimicrobiia bacterium EGI L10123]|uniref:RNA-binding cell elongation regulator Jag/EloR n=1 Tax=Salinilacustrithrix flava TaxID=2957203 RepID=UPI003D7C1A21|nr:Jag N-terminal domain-containing protein [Acidimicrobiia bacterium EGI L10123]
MVTTGRTVDEARERALDALGIDAGDLELEVLDEPGSSLFGLRRTDARVRARVRPTRPRPKLDRRNRRKGANGGGRRRRSKKDQDAAPKAKSKATSEPAPEPPAEPAPADEAAAPPDPAPQRSPARGRGRRRPEPPQTDDSEPRTGTTGDTMSDITLDEQEPSALGFVQGLVDAFGVDADVQATSEDDEHLEIAVTGDDLGLLVGPRGATLNAIQELTRTAVAQQHSGRLQGRLRVDVAGYRARRKEALERFAAQQADRVKDTGTPVALEPMSPPDRKIVHDAVNEIDGVHTSSEGEDRRRHVVILPD